MGCTESANLRHAAIHGGKHSRRRVAAELLANKTSSSASSSSRLIQAREDTKSTNISEGPRIPFPLSERDVISVMRSWKGVQAKIIETGLLVFLRMFEQTPEAKSVFEKFRSNDTPTEMFRHRDVLESHGLVVMNAIDEVISNLDDLDTVYQLLLDQGRSHSRFSELTEEIFWAIEKPFMLAVKDALGDHFSMNVERLYISCIGFILKNLVAGFHQAKAEDLKARQDEIKSNQ